MKAGRDPAAPERGGEPLQANFPQSGRRHSVHPPPITEPRLAGTFIATAVVAPLPHEPSHTAEVSLADAFIAAAVAPLSDAAEHVRMRLLFQVQAHPLGFLPLKRFILGFIHDCGFVSAGFACKIELPVAWNIGNADFVVKHPVASVTDESPAIGHVFTVRSISCRIQLSSRRIEFLKRSQLHFSGKRDFTFTTIALHGRAAFLPLDLGCEDSLPASYFVFRV